MKLVFVFALFSVVIASSFGLKCDQDSDCRKNECCIEYIPYFKRCDDMPDDVGDRCGGQFLCHCQNGLTCKPDEKPGFYGRFKLGTGNCA